MTLDRATQKQC